MILRSGLEAMNLSHCIVICWFFVQSLKCAYSDFISDGNRTVELTKNGTRTHHCSLYGSGNVTRNLLRNKRRHVTIVSEKELNNVIRACYMERDLYRPVRREKRSMMYPGTKWCGPGNEASNYNDLGKENETDKCCREHDHCDVTIGRFKKKFGLRNINPFVVSSCKCDDQFYNCLKKRKESVASSVGSIYFNILGMKCIYPSGNNTEQCEDTGWFGACKGKKVVVNEYKFRASKRF